MSLPTRLPLLLLWFPSLCLAPLPGWGTPLPTSDLIGQTPMSATVTLSSEELAIA